MTRSLTRRITLIVLGALLAGFGPGRAAEAPAARDEPAPKDKEKPITAEDRRHWAFVPPARPSLPAVRERGWVRVPIDAFVLATLEENGLSHAPEADRPTLLRRLSFDLTGLPPTPEELRAFLAD